MKSVAFGIGVAVLLAIFVGVVAVVIVVLEHIVGEWEPLVFLFLLVAVVCAVAHAKGGVD